MCTGAHPTEGLGGAAWETGCYNGEQVTTPVALVFLYIRKTGRQAANPRRCTTGPPGPLMRIQRHRMRPTCARGTRQRVGALTSHHDPAPDRARHDCDVNPEPDRRVALYSWTDVLLSAAGQVATTGGARRAPATGSKETEGVWVVMLGCGPRMRTKSRAAKGTNGRSNSL